jgi:uncharacterized protein
MCDKAHESELHIALDTVPPQGLRIDKHTDEAKIRPKGAGAAGLESVRITGVLEDLGGQYIFRGELHAELVGACVRCLGAARMPVSSEAVWLFEPGPHAEQEASDGDEEEDDLAPRVSRFSGREIDLAPMAWEELMLALPAKLICSESCQGLCPTCGEPLRDGSCGCAEKQRAGASGFAALREMFPDLPDGREKE